MVVLDREPEQDVPVQFRRVCLIGGPFLPTRSTTEVVMTSGMTYEDVITVKDEETRFCNQNLH